MNEVFFTSAQEKAVGYLSKYYNLQKLDMPDDASQQTSCYLLELEVLNKGITQSLKLTILFDKDFPLSLPSIFLSKDDVTRLGFLPNISTSGFICTFDTNTNIPNPNAPEKVLDECVARAKSIIEDGLKSNNLGKYDNEFIAYWENSFNDETSVDTRVLSLINQNGKVPISVNYVIFKPSIGQFNKLLFSDAEQFDTVKSHFGRHNIVFDIIPTFYLGPLDIWAPPYNISNQDAFTIIQNLGAIDIFTEYLKSRPLLPIVTFTRIINSKVLVFGWQHKPVQIKRRRHNKKLVEVEKKLTPQHYDKLLESVNSSVLVQRFSSQTLNRERLIQRTSADYSNHDVTRPIKIMIAGLGSIGSNLIPLFEKSNVGEYRLVDNDFLSLENIGRHFLGINDTGKKKSEALRDYLEKKNPLTIVHTRESKIVPLILREPEFLSACDFHFFCTGDANSETWIGHNIHESEWSRPSFFIWVEPYLAGGHCIYFNGTDSIVWENVFPNNRFTYNVISEETHQQTTFIKREAGCQVTFLPYSASNLQLFLSALYPKVLNIFKKGEKNKCFSWVGDLAILKGMNIGTSQYVENVESFSLIERPL